MDILVEVLLLLGELVLEVFGEALLEVGLSGLKEALGRTNRNPSLAAVGYLILGALVGGLSVWLWPQRLFRNAPVPGLSLLLSPLAGGAAMEAWGRYRRAGGHETTNLATFLGGAAFALAYALVRFTWIGW